MTSTPHPRPWIQETAYWALFCLCWKLLMALAAAVGIWRLVSRLMRWAGVTDSEALEALAALAVGAPFFLMLLIVFQLKH